MIRECQQCSKSYSYIRSNRKGNSASKCSACISRNKRRANKQRAVEYMGSACSICGYNKSIAALDFHHTDPKEKDFGIAQIGTWTWSKIKQELDKCILVCANCHRELEYNNNK